MKRNQKATEQRVVKEKFVRAVFPTLLPKNENQKKLAESLKSTSLVVVKGSAGTGKTLFACYHAARKLHYNDIKKIVLIRAYQPLAGRTTGYLPGDLLTKLQPYYQQMLDYIEDCLGKASTEIALKNGVVEICGLETIRGRSWDNCIVIVDEAQNLYPQEVQALVTRVGENCQMIVCGDTAQTDVKKGKNGLAFLEEIVERYNIPDSAFINFTTEDIVRSGMTRDFVIAFEAEAKAGRAI
jgi:phosphate starvation-inducible PhoH-like protein